MMTVLVKPIMVVLALAVVVDSLREPGLYHLYPHVGGATVVVVVVVGGEKFLLVVLLLVLFLVKLRRRHLCDYFHVSSGKHSIKMTKLLCRRGKGRH